MNDKTIRNWLKQSDYDNQTALAMLKSGRYLYVAFMCQQTIEKKLKAIFIEKHETPPPYIHNLIRLSELCGLDKLISQDLDNFMIDLNTYYLEARYNEDIDELSDTIDKNRAEYIYNKTQELIKWMNGIS